MTLRYTFLVLMLVTAGCGDAAVHGMCTTSVDCTGGARCIDGRCTTVDAGAADLGTLDAGADAGPSTCSAPCEGDTHCVAGACVPFDDGGTNIGCSAPSMPFAVAPRALCHWPTAGAALTDGPVAWQWARRVASTVVAGTFTRPTGEFESPPTWLVFATGTVSSSSAEEPAMWHSGGVLRVLDPSTCTLVDTLDEVPVAAWFEPAAIGDLDGDGVPEILAQSWAGDPAMSAPAYEGSGDLVAWKWDAALSRFRVWRRSTVGGAPENDLVYTAGYTVMGGPTIADLDDDGVPEVVLSGRVYDHELHRLTGQAPPTMPTMMSRAPPGGPYLIQEDVIADLDGDHRAELVYGDGIFTWTGSAWATASFFAPPTPLGIAHAVVADFGDLPGGVAGQPEVVAVGYDGVRVQTIDGRVLKTFTLPTGDRGGSAPSIADVDGDHQPEILVGVDQGLFVFDLECDSDTPPAACGHDTGTATGLPPLPRGVRWADRPPADAWDFMGATTFDFDADGRLEVAYADECFLRVYDGSTGAAIYSHWRPSRTASEVPIVVGASGGADTVIAIGLHTARFCSQATGVGGVPAYDPQFPGLSCASDRDCFGAAGSCVASRCRCTSDADCCAPGTSCPSVGFACLTADDAMGNTCRAVRVPDASAFSSSGALEEGIDVLTDAFGRWSPARPWWNQDAYDVVNVNDDGSVPRTSAVTPSWSTAGGNTFRSNVAGAMRVTAAADLRVSATACPDLDPAGATLGATVCNRGSRATPAGQSVRWSDAATGATLCETTTPDVIGIGHCAHVTCAHAPPAGTSVHVEVAREGRLPECGSGPGAGNAIDVTAPAHCP